MKADKPSIYVFSGYSGAGKDTAASVLVSATNIKFADPGKRALEFIYKLPEGFMDARIARQQLAPFSGGRSYLEVLVDFWRHRDLLVGSELFGEQTKAKILATLQNGKAVTVTDMRNYNELDVLTDLHELGYPITPIWIDGGKMLESDVYQSELFRKLCAITGSLGDFISNDCPTVTSFKIKVEKYLQLMEDRELAY